MSDTALASRTAPVRPGIFELAWPSITTNLLQALVGFIDTKIVGALGASAVAAVTSGHRIFFVSQALMMAVTAGTTALVARAWGAGDRAEAQRATRASLWLCAMLSAGITLVCTTQAARLASIFGLDARTTAATIDFLWWISIFHLGFTVQFVLGVALRAAGDVVTPLIAGALTNVVNVVLVYALVYGELPWLGPIVPAMGVRGAAIASGIAFSLGSLLLLLLWLAGRLRLSPGTGRALVRQRIRRLLRVGMPSAFEQFVFQGGFVAFLMIVALYGAEPTAAYGIGVNILSFSFVVGFGYSIAASTLVGQHLGAGDPAAATQAGWRAMWLSIQAMAVLGVAIVAAAPWIARFVIDDPLVVHYTVVFIWILGAVQPLMAIEFSLSGALRGAGDTRWPLISVMSGFLGVRLTLAALAAWLGLGVEWVYAALIGDYVVKAAILTLRFASGRWQQVRV